MNQKLIKQVYLGIPDGGGTAQPLYVHQPVLTFKIGPWGRYVKYSDGTAEQWDFISIEKLSQIDITLIGKIDVSNVAFSDNYNSISPYSVKWTQCFKEPCNGEEDFTRIRFTFSTTISAGLCYRLIGLDKD